MNQAGKGKSTQPRDANLSRLFKPKVTQGDEASSSSALPYDGTNWEVVRSVSKLSQFLLTEPSGPDTTFVIATQDKQCPRYRYRNAQHLCVSCREKTLGDDCRFIGIRQLTINDGIVLSSRLISNLTQDSVDLPRRWNITPHPIHLTAIKVSSSFSFLSLLFIPLACSMQSPEDSTMSFSQNLTICNDRI